MRRNDIYREFDGFVLCFDLWDIIFLPKTIVPSEDLAPCFAQIAPSCETVIWFPGGSFATSSWISIVSRAVGHCFLPRNVIFTGFYSSSGLNCEVCIISIVCRANRKRKIRVLQYSDDPPKQPHISYGEGTFLFMIITELVY